MRQPSAFALEDQGEKAGGIAATVGRSRQVVPTRHHGVILPSMRTSRSEKSSLPMAFRVE